MPRFHDNTAAAAAESWDRIRAWSRGTFTCSSPLRMTPRFPTHLLVAGDYDLVPAPLDGRSRTQPALEWRGNHPNSAGTLRVSHDARDLCPAAKQIPPGRWNKGAAVSSPPIRNKRRLPERRVE